MCGPQNWQVSYSILSTQSNGDNVSGILCRIGIKSSDGWCYKEDGAEPTDIEAFKGGISSAFKRCASAWGVGRYLYDLEEGFATVVERGTPGSRYAKANFSKIKDKPDWNEFFWVPPRLPEWATPKRSEVARPPSNLVEALKIGKALGWDKDTAQSYCMARWNVDQSTKLAPQDYQELLRVISSVECEQACSDAIDELRQ